MVAHIHILYLSSKAIIYCIIQYPHSPIIEQVSKYWTTHISLGT